MTLRSKLAAILIALVGTTALVVSVLGYRAARAGTLPSLISDLDSRASLVSLGFQALVMGGTQDARTVAAVLASLATVRDGASEESEDLLRAMAEGKPQYLQVRLLGRTGREVLRVDRDPVAGTAHVLPADSLQDKSDRPYVQAGLGLGVGEIYVSPIDLNEEFGQVEEPYVAVLRVVAPIFDSEGELQGLAVFNLDMTRQLAQMRQTGPARTDLYMVSGEGEFLVHPDPAREFERSRGVPVTLDQDAWLLDYAEEEAGFVEGPDGRTIVWRATFGLGNGPETTLYFAADVEALMASAPVVRSVLRSALAVTLIAILLATFAARWLSRPALLLVGAVERLDAGKPWEAPPGMTAEFQTLSVALDTLVRSQRAKTEELELEVEERKEAERRVQVAIEASPNGMLVANADGTIRSVNAEVERIFGYSRDELIGHPVEMLIPKSHRDGHPAQRAAFRAEPSRRSMGGDRELFGLRSDGTEIPVEIGLNPITTVDGAQVLASIVDISERRDMIDNLRRSNAELEQFAYVASHDLQEPLRMIASFTGLLGERYAGQLDERADRYIHFAVDGAKRMQRLIDDLLIFSRVTSHAGPLEPVNTYVLAHWVADHILSAALVESGGELEILPLPVVVVDQGQLEQVFMNLIGNAVKFRDPERRLKVTVGAEESDGQWEFYVRDNGIGIEPGHDERVFQMFQRLHGVGKYPGSGIGLALVRKIIERHGGRIWYEPTEGFGTTFRFTLPRTGETE